MCAEVERSLEAQSTVTNKKVQKLHFTCGGIKIIKYPKYHIVMLLVFLLSIIGTVAGAEDAKPAGTVSIESFLSYSHGNTAVHVPHFEVVMNLNYQ